MSMTKLTLSADKRIIEQAKELAREDGTSVSAMFSEFIRARGLRKRRKPTVPGPLTRQALGIGKKASNASPNKPDKELLEDALVEKYGPES